MRMTISGLFVGTAALALAACGGDKPTAVEETVVETETEVDPEDAMTEETTEPTPVPLEGTGTPIGPSASEAEE